MAKMRCANWLLATACCILQLAAGQNPGYTKTFGGNAGGAECEFPFQYQGVIYSDCTTTNYKNTPWCATTSNYDQDRKWGQCDLSLNAARTTGGNSQGKGCVFPFTYQGVEYRNCTSKNHDRPWCSTTSNYPKDRKWGNCVTYLKVATTGGNSVNGSECVFPFKYGKLMISGCLYSSSSRGSWCSTTANYDKDGKWAKCVLSQRTTGTCSNTYTRYADSFSVNGEAVRAARTKDACEMECNARSKCIGYDFNNRVGVDTRCFIHARMSDLSARAPAPGIEQYAVRNRCAQACSTEYETLDNTLSYGGREAAAATSVALCEAECNKLSDCVGFDFDKNNEQKVRCYTHRTSDNFRTRSRASGIDEYVVDTKVCSSVATLVGNTDQPRCYFPYRYKGEMYMTCNSRSWYKPWCATTPNYDRDRKWGDCDVNAV